MSLKFFIEQVLNEMDLTELNPAWLSTYAFVQAYNDGISQGLFPRAQRMDIEFDENLDTQGVFKNGTIYVNPMEIPDVEFFKTEAGHDMLHGLTQNIQMHFGQIKNRTEKENERQGKINGQDRYNGQPTTSKGNAKKFSYQDLKKMIQYAKKNFNVDFDELIPETPLETIKQTILKRYPTNKNTEQLKDFIRTEMQLQRTSRFREIIDMINSNRIKWPKLYASYRENMFGSRDSRNYFQQNFDQDGNPSAINHYNSTHAIEEEFGNVVSDAIAKSLAANDPISDHLVQDILFQLTRRMNNWRDFKPTENDINWQIADHWEEYLTNLLPKFVQLYNKRLAMLQRTKIGTKQPL